ncbi:rhodopsin, G0-coupled-like [Babylonia areolata]|uniref:rhodopsin, G0-coupled-like n=1 Tax=Babylonia areolata TaxID=304850 RepID=UPI003FD3073B
MEQSHQSDGNGYVYSNVTSPSVTSAAPLSDQGYIAIGVYLVILYSSCYVSAEVLLACVGNVTVLMVIVSQRTALRKMQNILLVNMASADLMVTLTAYPLTAVSSFHRRWLFGDLTCQIGGFLVFMLTMVSMDTLTVIAVFRYILVCKPKYHHLLGTDVARPVLLAIWAHSLLWTSLPLFGWNRYVPEPFLTSCTIDWVRPDGPGRAYVVLTVLTCYALHVGVVTFCYARILLRSRQLTFGARQNSSLVKLEEVLWHHKVETERSVTKMCAVMMLAFMVCWTPYAALSVLTSAGVRLSVGLTTLPTMFAKLSCALNPFIYALLCSKFRQAFSALNPRAQRGQNRVATAAIELPVSSETKPLGREAVETREYRGDMTNQGVYIGNVAVSLEVQSTVF